MFAQATARNQAVRNSAEAAASLDIWNVLDNEGNCLQTSWIQSHSDMERDSKRIVEVMLSLLHEKVHFAFLT